MTSVAGDASRDNPDCDVQWDDNVTKAVDCPPLPPTSGAICGPDAPNAVCVYPDPKSTPAKPSLLAATCGSPYGRSGQWLAGPASCRDTCPSAPTPGGTVTDIDAGSCELRPLQRCESGLTRQQQLDATLSALVVRRQIPILLERTLFVEFEHGCPRRASNLVLSDSQAAAAAIDALAGVRWECAKDLSCSSVNGPSTIAAQ